MEEKYQMIELRENCNRILLILFFIKSKKLNDEIF